MQRIVIFNIKELNIYIYIKENMSYLRISKVDNFFSGNDWEILFSTDLSTRYKPMMKKSKKTGLILEYIRDRIFVSGNI